MSKAYFNPEEAADLAGAGFLLDPERLADILSAMTEAILDISTTDQVATSMLPEDQWTEASKNEINKRVHAHPDVKEGEIIEHLLDADMAVDKGLHYLQGKYDMLVDLGLDEHERLGGEEGVLVARAAEVRPQYEAELAVLDQAGLTELDFWPLDS